LIGHKADLADGCGGGGGRQRLFVSSV